MRIFIKFGLFLILLVFTNLLFGQTTKVPGDFCINADEYKLYQLINQYREKLSLDPIPLSKSLSYVAKTHAIDLSENYNASDDCNMYSWSDKGDWKPFCYPADQNRKNDIKDKANEISGYPGKAYEITYWDNTDVSPEDILSFWTGIEYTGSLISNASKFSSISWKSMGVGINQDYVLVWFGEAEDLEAYTILCETGEKIYNKSIPNELQVPASATSANPEQQHFYIIIGSYNRKDDAKSAIKSYNEMGYPNAVMVEEQGKTRVAIDHFDDKSEADKALAKYRDKFKGAWIFSK